MDKAHGAYDEGVRNYHSGHLVKAREEFDRAIDLVLQSGLDVNAYPALKKEFDRLLDNIHSYEMTSLKEGDGFTEQRTVQAPIDEVSDLTFPVEPGLKEKVAREILDTRSDLPLVINDHVLGYINHFSSRGKVTVINGLRRAGRYRDMIHRIFEEEGVPQDLIYLAQAESSFQPLALSRMGARGIWQFMPSRGREYGLDHNWWVDLRQDPEKSTRAAARHLRDLYRMFGDWYLAMAAYNSGPANVRRAVERTGYADFWELYRRNVLPRETRNYVPIILAVTIMAKNPEKYGLTEVVPEPPVAAETLKLSTPTDLRLIAETIDSDVELLHELNPSLLRWVTPNQDDFELKLPAGTKERFLERIAMIPEDKRVWWRWHRVAPGESLGEIAKNFKTTAAAIAEVNNLDSDQPLQMGAQLVIPITPKKEEANVRMVRLRYRIRKGDTVARVADRFGVTPLEVRQWNGLRSNKLRPGRVLLIRAVQSDYQARPRSQRAAAKFRSSKGIASKGRAPSKRPATAKTAKKRQAQHPQASTQARVSAFNR